MPYCTCPACRNLWIEENECFWLFDEFIESIIQDEESQSFQAPEVDLHMMVEQDAIMEAL